MVIVSEVGRVREEDAVNADAVERTVLAFPFADSFVSAGGEGVGRCVDLGLG